MRKSYLTAYSIIFAILSISSQLFAVGFGFEYQSVMGSSRGNTMVAHKESSSAVHYNPGALAFLERAQTEVNFFSGDGEIEWDTGAQTYKTNNGYYYLASAFAAYPFKLANRDWSVGLGYTRPYGQSASWPQNFPARNSGYGGEMDFEQVGLSLSHRVTERFGLGVTLHYFTSDLTSESGLALPTDEFVFDGDTDGFSVHVGAFYNYSDDLRFGINYRSGAELNHRGTYNYESNNPFVPGGSSSGSVRFSIPSHVAFGIEYDLSEKTTLAWQSQWTEWSVVDSYLLENNGVEQSVPVLWNNGWIHSVGVSYDMNERVTLHAGYLYTESIIDDHLQTALHADYDQHMFSAGASFHFEDWKFDLAAVYIHSEDLTINNSTYGISGKHDAEGFLINAGIVKKF